MSANNISILPNKQAKQLAKLDIAQAKRQGYSSVVPAGTQDYNLVSVGNFGALKVISDGAGHTYLVFALPIPAIQSYLYVGAPLHNVRFGGVDHIDAVSIAGPLVDCSTLAGFPQAGALGYLLSATLSVATNNNVGILSFPNGRFTGNGTANTSAVFYRANNHYDITELPTEYSGSGNGLIDNPNSTGLLLGRPWTT